MDKWGVGGILTVGWMILAAYLAVLLFVSFSLIAYEFLRSKFKAVGRLRNPLAAAQEVEHS